jgi:hypothetical protein
VHNFGAKNTGIAGSGSFQEARKGTDGLGISINRSNSCANSFVALGQRFLDQA